MNGIMTDAAVQRMLDDCTGHSTHYDLSNAKVMLFKNNVTPTDSTVLGDLAEADFPGYARVTLSSGNWPGSSVTAHVASATYSLTITFTCTGGGASQTVYGVGLVTNDGTTLIAAANFDSGPYTMVNNGDSISETLTVSNQSLH